MELKDIRKALQLNQSEMARFLDQSPSMQSKIEFGERKMSEKSQVLFEVLVNAVSVKNKSARKPKNEVPGVNKVPQTVVRRLKNLQRQIVRMEMKIEALENVRRDYLIAKHAAESMDFQIIADVHTRAIASKWRELQLIRYTKKLLKVDISIILQVRAKLEALRAERDVLMKGFY